MYKCLNCGKEFEEPSQRHARKNGLVVRWENSGRPKVKVKMIDPKTKKS